MGYDDADTFGVNLPQAVSWEMLKYDVISKVDIGCRIAVGERRLPLPLLRCRLRVASSDDLGYSLVLQMYLHRAVSLGAFGPRFTVYCQADGPSATLVQLRAASDAAFESAVLTRLLAWGYGMQWRIVRALDAGSAKDAHAAMSQLRVYFDDVLAYDFGQLTEEAMRDGFHRRGFAFLADRLRAELAAV